MYVQDLGDKLNQSRFAQPSEPQAEASQERYSPDVPSKSAAVSRRGSGMPFASMKAPAASRRGSAAAAGPLDLDISNDVSTRHACGLGQALLSSYACQASTQSKTHAKGWLGASHIAVVCSLLPQLGPTKIIATAHCRDQHPALFCCTMHICIHSRLPVDCYLSLSAGAGNAEAA